MRVERLRNGIATLSLLAACFTSCTFLASAPLPTPPVPDSVAAVEVEAPAPLGPTALDLIVERFSTRQSGLSTAEIRAVASTIIEASARNGLDWELVLAVIQTESGYYNFARSKVNALGLMQLLPSTGAEVAAELGIDWQGANTLFDPSVNVELGTFYLGQLQARYGDRRRALAAYNWGPAKIARRLRGGLALPARYVNKVQTALLVAARP